MHPLTVTATKAKVHFGAIMDKVKDGRSIIVEKNGRNQIVLISVDEYEDFLELKNKKFQKRIQQAQKQIRNGQHGSLENLYTIHRKTITKEAN